MNINDQLQTIISLLQSIDKRLSYQSRPATQSTLKKHVEIVAKITSSPFPYKNGTGDFYDAKTDKGEPISLGVPRQKLPGRALAIGEIVHCYADEAQPSKNGIMRYFFSEMIYDQAPSKQPEIPLTQAPDQTNNTDVPF